jgi:hypothetical protein
MPNLPYSSTDWSTTRQHAPKQVSYPFLRGESPDKYARIIRRFYEGTSYPPTADARTSWSNLLTYSADLSNAAWTKADAAAAANILANPWDGSVSASRVLETATTAPHGVTQAYTFTGGQVTFMAILRAGLTRNHALLRLAVGASTWDCFFNISTGTVGTASGATGSIVALGDGWFLCILVATPTAGAGTVQVLGSTDGSTLTYLGSVSAGFYLANAQLDTVSTDGPLIVTTNATRTVSAPPTDRSQNSAADSTADPFAYLVAEEGPEPAGPAGLVRWVRTYARIPATRYEPSASLFNRLLADDSAVTVSATDYWVVSFDDESFVIWNARQGAVCAAPTATELSVQSTGIDANVGDQYVIWSGNRIVALGIVTTRIDADNFRAPLTDVRDGTAPSANYVAVVKDGWYRVATGPIDASARLVRRFYLPGVSTGVTNSGDIPAITIVTRDPVTWLEAVIAYLAAPSDQTWLVDGVSNFSSWQGCIYEKAALEVQAQDVVKTIDLEA